MARLSLLALYRRRARRCQPYFDPCISRSAWGMGQPPWLSHCHRAVPWLRTGLRCHSKGWEGWPQDLLPHLTVPRSHPGGISPGHLAVSAGGVRYGLALPRLTGRSEVTCEGFTGWRHPTAAANWEGWSFIAKIGMTFSSALYQFEIFCK